MSRSNEALTEITPSEICIILWIIQKAKSNIIISEFDFCIISENLSPQNQIVSEKVLFKKSNFSNNVPHIS